MPHDAQLAAGMAIGSILSLLMLSAVLLRKCCIGRRHHKHAKVLLVGTAAELLLGSQFGGACFNAVCVFQWLTDAQGETQWLRDFGVCASGFYFLALAWHLLSTTRSPFAPPSTLPLHAMANACAIVAATLAAMLGVSPFPAERVSLLPLRFPKLVREPLRLSLALAGIRRTIGKIRGPRCIWQPVYA